MKPNYKNVTHYNTGQPWDKQKEHKSKKLKVALDSEEDHSHHWQWEAMHSYIVAHKKNESKVVATIYKAQVIASGYQTGETKEVNGVEYAVYEHGVYDKKAFFYSYNVSDWFLLRHVKILTLTDRVKSFLDTEEFTGKLVKSDYTLLILPEYIQTERDKEEKVARLEAFVKERVEAEKALLLTEVRIYRESIVMHANRIAHQIGVIADQRLKIEMLEARLAGFEAAKAVAEARRFNGVNNRVFAED